MGTIVYRSTKADAVRRELADLQVHSVLLANRLIGPRLWFLAEREGVRWIGLTLIECRGDEVAVKHMDETVGPYHYDCPLSYLDRATAPHGPHAGPWREKVRAFHAGRQARRTQRAQAQPGQRLHLGCHVYQLQEPLGRRGWVVRRESDGMRMRMLARQLSQVEWLSTTARPPGIAGVPIPPSQPT